MIKCVVFSSTSFDFEEHKTDEQEGNVVSLLLVLFKERYNTLIVCRTFFHNISDSHRR